MPTSIERDAPTSLLSADLTPRGNTHPSPVTWRDQILYFLLPDRFSDGNEDGRPRFDRANPTEFRTPDKRAWMAAGTVFQGGTLKGIQSKLDYLRDLGVTALWIGPIWRQRPDLQTYHGYGIQNYLDIDPRFGTRQDLRDLVDAAHQRGMYVLLDIIYNHSGNNWFYQDQNGNPAGLLPYRFAPPYPFHGWHSRDGQSSPTIGGTDDGVWPEQFQNLDWYTRAGQIGRWDPEQWEDPLDPNLEFRRGDFFDLKDVNVNRDDTLAGLVKVYQYWIALSDCDGFRMDAVKHVPWEASRNFCGAIREYAESVGKENFLLLGEVTGGGDMVRNYLEVFGRNVDAALDVGAPARRLVGMAKGLMAPGQFFDQFGGHDSLGSHRETGRYHVSILDDHDMVGRDGKHRFAANNTIPSRYEQTAHAVGIQLTTVGIPCIYYGTEQALDGTEARHDYGIENRLTYADRYIREVMFGGTFGASETSGCHFFDPEHPTYLRISAIARIRSQDDQIGRTLRRGRQYMRETSVSGSPFTTPQAGELVAWSRILFDQEVLVALNTHGTESREGDVTVCGVLHPVSSVLRVLYRGDWNDADLRDPPEAESVVVEQRHGRSAVHVVLPPAGMVILA